MDATPENIPIKPEGMIEFERKPAALEAVKRCSEGCFFLTSSLRPVIAELIEENEDEDGMQEKMLQKRNAEYHSEREVMKPNWLNMSSCSLNNCRICYAVANKCVVFLMNG